MAAAGTSAVSRLVPQNPLQVCGPGFLQLHAGGLQGVGVAAFPPAEPDFEAHAAHAGVVRHADVAGLEQKKNAWKQRSEVVWLAARKTLRERH